MSRVLSRVLLGQGFTAEPLGKRVAFCRPAAAKPPPVLAAFLAVFLAFLPAVCALPGGALAQPAGASDAPGARMLALVNAERAKEGQPPLAFEARLHAAACRQARDLARGGPLSHRGSDGSDLGERVTAAGYPFAMAAENLAAGITTPDETVWLWSGSPGHRRNMLTPDFRDAGIAHLPGAGGEVWVLVLGTQRAASAIPLEAQKPRNTKQNAGQSAVQERAAPHDLRGDKPLTCY